MKKFSSQRTGAESQSKKAGGFSFEQFLEYKKYCADPERLHPQHLYYDFDLQSHNANAEQIEKIAQRREDELNTPQPRRNRRPKLVQKITESPAITYPISPAKVTKPISAKEEQN